MKKLLPLLALLSSFSSCAVGKTLEKSLNDALTLATGPCGVKVAEAAAVCKEQMPK